MAKKEIIELDHVNPYEIMIPDRFSVPVPCRKIDQTVETVQGKSDSVQQLFQDYVLGRLDPARLAGGSYDDEASEDVDPFNTFGLDLEDVSRISDEGLKARGDVQDAIKRKQASPAPKSQTPPPSGEDDKDS